MSGDTPLGTDPVEVVPYDPRWPRMFGEERQRILGALGPRTLEVVHIGSTAVTFARRFRHDRAGYMDGKEDFVRAVEMLALEEQGA